MKLKFILEAYQPPHREDILDLLKNGQNYNYVTWTDPTKHYYTYKYFNLIIQVVENTVGGFVEVFIKNPVGKIHNIYGPAYYLFIETDSNVDDYYLDYYEYNIDGKRHREDGPAGIWPKENKIVYSLNDRTYSKEEYEKIIDAKNT